MNRAARGDGQWICGVLERGNVNQMFLKVVFDRMEETLVNMIFQHKEPSTTIMIDCWTACDTASLT
jgi:hypothetical protein